jgi:hypothetical protein
MNEYLQFKQNIRERVGVLEEIVSELEGAGLADGPSIHGWSEQLSLVLGSLQDPLLRVAVVGSVKSGKSTLINALMGKDLLRRGAGIITSFIARIRANEEIGGWVDLKPWSQILEELNATLRLMPVLRLEASGDEPLDIRRSEDRLKISSWLEEAKTEGLHGTDAFDPNLMVLSGYLDGYDLAHSRVADAVSRIELGRSTLGEHRQYVGHEGQAVYIRDMELHHPIPWLGESVEIGDCQGSDSPNPLHFALLQQYLLKSHFILYVISSRTGLREADFKLLDLIKRMRMFPQTFFALNADLDAHSDSDDLERITERVRTELGWVAPHPRLFTFSALLELVEQLNDAGDDRERRRAELWKTDGAMTLRSHDGFASFREHMGRRIIGQRTRVLLGSSLNRICVVVGTVRDTVNAQERFMSRNLGDLHKSSEQLKRKQKVLQGTLGTLEKAISGLKDSLKQELEGSVSRYFDPVEGPIVRETLDMVDRYPVDPRFKKDLTDYLELSGQLHRFYLKFRQDLYRYLVEQVNLRAIEYAREEEAFLLERLNRSAHAFWSLYRTALEDYRQSMAPFHIEVRIPNEAEEMEWPLAGEVPPPSFSDFVDQGAVGPGVLLVKFGLGRFSRFLLRLKSSLGKRKGFGQKGNRGNDIFDEAVTLVKSEAKAELMDAFSAYRVNFQFDYLYRVLEEGTRSMLDEFTSRAGMARLDFAGLLDRGQKEGEDRQAAVEVLSIMGRKLDAIMKDLDDLRCAVNLEWASGQEDR